MERRANYFFLKRCGAVNIPCSAMREKYKTKLHISVVFGAQLTPRSNSNSLILKCIGAGRGKSNPSSEAWEASALPLSYTRIGRSDILRLIVGTWQITDLIKIIAKATHKPLLNNLEGSYLPPASWSFAKISQLAMNMAAITGPITKPLKPKTASPPRVDSSTT